MRIGHIIGPPLWKLSTKKFLSNIPVSAAGLAAALAAGVAVGVVVVAGDMAVVAGVVPAIGEIPGAVAAGVVTAPGAVIAGLVAGLVAAAGTAGATGFLGGALAAAGGGGDTWPNEVNAMVREQRLAISSVFIGLIGKFISRLEFR
jgi:hypothetical protein